jgi:hypothetical protein
MRKQIERADALAFLRNWVANNPSENEDTFQPLGKSFVDRFNVFVPSRSGLEVFGYDPGQHLDNEADTFAALAVIEQHFLKPIC